MTTTTSRTGQPPDRCARGIGHLGRHLLGRARRRPAVDPDGTVRGGVPGDYGAEDVDAADSHLGETLGAFRRVTNRIGPRGVPLRRSARTRPTSSSACCPSIPV